MRAPVTRSEPSPDDAATSRSRRGGHDKGRALSSREVNLSERTTFRIGGKALEFYAPSSVRELRLISLELAAEGKSPFFLGGGANTLFPDGEYTRPVISMERFRTITREENCLTVGAGVRLGTLIRTAVRAGLGGLEVFVGIPGTCGGAIRMNAGGAGSSFGERVVELGVMPRGGGPVERLNGNAVSWGYRTTDLRDCVILWAKLKLEPDDVSSLRKHAGRVMQRKAAAQPYSSPSAGCVFRNPQGYHAGELIDRFGLKGLSCGGAQISERHANFIVNANGRATASDVKSLVATVSEVIQRNIGVRMQTEVVIA